MLLFSIFIFFDFCVTFINLEVYPTVSYYAQIFRLYKILSMSSVITSLVIFVIIEYTDLFTSRSLNINDLQLNTI